MARYYPDLARGATADTAPGGQNLPDMGLEKIEFMFYYMACLLLSAQTKKELPHDQKKHCPYRNSRR
jgi:hypothetical protein